jgi:hypothetical protein
MDTNDEYGIFNNYYLWLLLDYYHFQIEDVEEIYVFEKNCAFKEFGEMFMTKRMESKDDVGNLFYKICLNNAYNYNTMNTENFSRSSIVSASDVYSKIFP